MSSHNDPLVRQTRSSLFTIAAFFYATTIFLCVQKQFNFSPTAPVGVGRVTIEQASKLHDYASFVAFLLIVPAGTLFLRRVGQRRFRSLRRASEKDGALYFDSILFTLPFLASPFVFLTTRKEGFALLLAPLLASLTMLARRRWQRTTWIRQLYRHELAPFHALIVLEAASWILFRYLVMGSRIAHIATLFLEVFFVLFFIAIFQLATLLIVRVAQILFQADPGVILKRIALTGLPLLLLPIAGLTLQPREALFLAAVALMFAILPWTRRIASAEGSSVRRFLVRCAIPVFLFVFTYAGSAAPSYLDLFHRGETLGPASDYLRGKAPYRDVFVLHGLLEDGQLDAWLMEIFGRDARVSIARITLIGALTLPLLFAIGILIFDSIPLALITAALGLVTTVDNQRLVFHLAVVAALLAWSRGVGARATRGFLLLAGAVSALALFYSLDMGIYAIAGSLAAISVVPLTRKQSLRFVASSMIWFLAGFAAGALPFFAYLASRSALGGFFETSLVTVPAVIDAVWSLPYPNLSAPFRNDLSLRALADYVLGEQMRFILNPLLIAIAIIVILIRWRRGIVDRYTSSLVILSAAFLVAQRSALGRADFQHQYFAAYLAGPILLVLLILAIKRVRSVASTQRDLPFQTLLAGVAILAAFVILWIPDLLNAKLDGIVKYRPRLSRIGYVDAHGEAVLERIERVRYFVHLATRRDDAIFDFSNQPAFYFFLDRRNATRFYQVPIISPASFQKETIDALEKSKPPLLLRNSPEGFDHFDGIPNEVRAKAVATYLDDNYRYWRSASGVELWRRNPAPGKAAPARITVHVPGVVKEWSSETLVLPAVGSVTGAGGAQWRSDIVMYNPYAEPLTISMRYAADRGNRERPVTISPHITQMHKDVAAAFFGLPDSRGAVFIRYPRDRKPILTLQSYDLTRPSSRVTETPLSTHQAAVAGSDHYALSLVGIEQQGERRVNLGIINIGHAPLRVKIVCRTHDGKVVGVPIRAVIDEGASYSLVDAPAELGVPFSGGVTVHIEVLAGAAIGYASVIDPQTGAHDLLGATPSSYKR